ncbi:amino acid ABC transporter ATP-binding protein [Clostridium sp. ZS2-4]|uniref:amino acid ABC transporter ATP-binding protein n=1 Tax=Clostridium sp. ZS2-4 TaxID=2987703 RepID=UPI00227B9E6F|nr:amino acid ABC transporter ATP-binding protein [Clostridium sp. ZS2-4]MCY6356879.1 amino acid ABC transporter ATP-binding protein [Clostridium sp. ZS2-4]
MNNICKDYNNKKVLKEINLKLENIHSLGIIGPSGGGKSTLLRLIAGLENTDSGTIEINNTTLKNEENYLNEYRKTVGVIFQAYNLFPHLTAKENVKLPLIKVHGKNKEIANKITEKLFERFLLKEHMNKKPNQLSGGQQQRVAIIRALSSEPQILLCDEPTSALDPELTEEVLSAIYEVKAEGKDLIMVTHHMEFAKKTCDYMLFIADGKIIEHGKSEEFFNNPKTERLIKFLNLM